MGTSTVLSAMEWRQPPRLPTTSSGDICMPACKLHKNRRVSSGLSYLMKRAVQNTLCHAAGGRVWADMQQRIVDGKGSRNWENDLCERARKGTLWFRPHNVLWKLFLESSSYRNEDLLRVKEDEADEQHKCIIKTLKAAAPEWTFEQINFVAGRRDAVVADDFHHDNSLRPCTAPPFCSLQPLLRLSPYSLRPSLL